MSLNITISKLIDDKREYLVTAITDQYYQEYPDLNQRYGKDVRHHILQDNRYHLTYLAEAVAAGHPSLFANYIGWAKVLLNGMNIPAEELAKNLNLLRTVLKNELKEPGIELIEDYIEQGLHQLPALPVELPSFIHEDQPYAALARQYLDLLLAGDRRAASKLILDVVQNQNVSIKDIYLNVFQHSQYEIGRLWQMNRISVAQEHYCTAATQMIMSQLYPFIFSNDKCDKTMVATCVGGDLHELGIRMVADFFEMAGWDTYYLGANTPTPSVIDELKERTADLLTISVTMTFHVRAAESLIKAVHSECQNVKIMVGGHPFNLEPSLWQQLGADAYSCDAQQAIDVANNLIVK